MSPPSRWGLFALVLVLVALVWPIPARAQDDIVAFGDSITQGPFPFDEERRGGYPDRLQDLLRAAGMDGVKVHNEGLSSETTSEGLSRLNTVLGKHKNVGTFIIMEGTNDVTKISRGELSMETTVRNLEAMAARVRSDAITAMYSSIIPRPNWVRWDKNNSVTFTLVFRLRELTSGGNRPMAEPFEIFENEGSPGFKKYYWCCDPVGHPKGAGFDLLAELFADKVLGNDTLAPMISSFTKTGSYDQLQAGDRLHAIIHENGEGIRSDETFFTLNGRTLSTDVVGSKRRVELDYQVKARCY